MKAFSMIPIKHLVRKGASFWKVTLSLPAGKDKQDCDRYSVES